VHFGDANQKGGWDGHNELPEGRIYSPVIEIRRAVCSEPEHRTSSTQTKVVTSQLFLWDWVKLSRYWEMALENVLFRSPRLFASIELYSLWDPSQRLDPVYHVVTIRYLIHGTNFSVDSSVRSTPDIRSHRFISSTKFSGSCFIIAGTTAIVLISFILDSRARSTTTKWFLDISYHLYEVSWCWISLYETVYFDCFVAPQPWCKHYVPLNRWTVIHLEWKKVDIRFQEESMAIQKTVLIRWESRHQQSNVLLGLRNLLWASWHLLDTHLVTT